jgi:hypothetical protein
MLRRYQKFRKDDILLTGCSDIHRQNSFLKCKVSSLRDLRMSFRCRILKYTVNKRRVDYRQYFIFQVFTYTNLFNNKQ